MISSERMMSTPAATRVESVREKRAMPILTMIAPIPNGIFMRKRSHMRRPDSVFLKRRNAKMIPAQIGKTMYQ